MFDDNGKIQTGYPCMKTPRKVLKFDFTSPLRASSHIRPYMLKIDVNEILRHA